MEDCLPRLRNYRAVLLALCIGLIVMTGCEKKENTAEFQNKMETQRKVENTRTASKAERNKNIRENSKAIMYKAYLAGYNLESCSDIRSQTYDYWNRNLQKIDEPQQTETLNFLADSAFTMCTNGYKNRQDGEPAWNGSN